MPTKLWQEQCQLIVRTGSKARSSAAPALGPVSGAYGPTDLQSAYALASAASANGAGTVVAITDAFSDPNLASDMAHYRAQYGLPACDTTTGDGCLTVVNENGASPSGVPGDRTGGWEAEQALDVEMVSAICPNCKIVMYEANSASTTDLGTAENSAAAGNSTTGVPAAKFISNSWSGFDSPGE